MNCYEVPVQAGDLLYHIASQVSDLELDLKELLSKEAFPLLKLE
jgi:hypothetical protein